MIGLGKLGKSYGDRTLFADVSLELNAGARYGLVGANGSGKTTLLSILAGDEPASEGEVTMPAATRLGVLRQERQLALERRIIDIAMMGDPVWQLLCEQEALLEQGEAAASRIADLEERIRAADGYTLPARAGAVLEGLGIGTAAHQRPLSTLSGGYQLRVLLAQTLVGRPDLLLLDEPTNHLDILTIRWLEKFLTGFTGCAVIVSHDHRFLDNVATHILDVDYELVTLYEGNYGRFLLDKVATRTRMETEIARQQKIIADKRAFIERFRYKATKARQAQSRAKQIEKIEKELREPPRSSRRSPSFRFEQQRSSGQQVLEIEALCKSYGDQQVLREVSLMLSRGERLAILGANGLGKSTLLRLLVDRLAPDQGRIGWGYHAQVGYFPQDHGELLDDPGITALEYLWSSCPNEPTRFVRGQLGALLFSGEDVDKKVGSLSGGEAARLIFSRIIVAKPNVLVLDEPTNHLDLEAIEALVGALQRFPGTIVFVSHDRWFVSELATRIVEVRADGIEDYPGGYAAYLSHCGDDHLDAEQVVLRARQDKAEARADKPVAGGWQDQKRRRGEHRRLLTERDRLTAAIDAGEKRLAEIEQLYCHPGFFETTSAERIEQLRAEQAALGPRIEALMAAWERTEETLALISEPATES